MPQILIVDDHPLVREAVSCVRACGCLDQSTIREAGSVNEACQAARLHPQPDLILFDLMLPDVSGLDGLSRDPAPFPGRPGSCVYRPRRCEDCRESDGARRGRLCAKDCAKVRPP